MIAAFRTVQALAADLIYVEYPAFLAQFYTFLPPPDRQFGRWRSTDTPPSATGTEAAACSTPTSQRVPNYSYRPWFRSRVVWAMAKTNECTERGMPSSDISLCLFCIRASVLPADNLEEDPPHYTLLTHLPYRLKHWHSSNRGVIIMMAVLIR